MASVRYEISPEDFYADDGQTKFIDRVASVLQVEVWRIKIVSIERGSTKVIYQIQTKYVDNFEAKLEDINADLNEVYSKLVDADPQSFSILGANVLNSEFYLIDENNKGSQIKFTGGDKGPTDEDDNVKGNSGTGMPTQSDSGVDAMTIAAIAGGSTLFVAIGVGVYCKSKKQKQAKKAAIVPA